MIDRIRAEIELVRSRYPSLQYEEDALSARIPDYPLPAGWGRETADLVFKVPRDIFGEQPYGFWVRPPLALPAGGVPSSTSGPVETAFGDGFQQFSWAPDGWSPGPEPQAGSNMLDWVRSFQSRLREVN